MIKVHVSRLTILAAAVVAVCASKGPLLATSCTGLGDWPESIPYLGVEAVIAAEGRVADYEVVGVTGFLEDVRYGRSPYLCSSPHQSDDWGACISLEFDFEALGRRPEALRALRAMEGREVLVVGRLYLISEAERSVPIFDIDSRHFAEVVAVHVAGQANRSFCLEQQREVLTSKRLRDCLLDSTTPFACFDPLGPVVWVDTDWSPATAPMPITYAVPDEFDLEDLTDAMVLSDSTLLLQYGGLLYGWDGHGLRSLELSAGDLWSDPSWPGYPEVAFYELKSAGNEEQRQCPGKRVDQALEPRCDTEAALLFLCGPGWASQEFAPGRLACLSRNGTTIWLRTANEEYRRLDYGGFPSDAEGAIIQDFEAESETSFLFSTDAGLLRWDRERFTMIDGTPTLAIIVVESEFYYRTRQGAVRKLNGDSWMPSGESWQQLWKARAPEGPSR